MQHEQARAARAVERVLAGTALPSALASVDDDPARRGRALTQELAYGTLRHFGTLRALTAKLAAKPIADPAVAALIAVALYQLEHTRAPAFAVVDRAVSATSLIAKPAAKTLVNALLRRFLREREALLAAVRTDPEGRWSYPRWWIARLRKDWPKQWRSMLEAGNERPPLTLRVNERATTREALLADFASAGNAARAAGVFGIIVAPPRPLAELPRFTEGAFTVQDLAAQLAAPIVDAADGMRVLDACAAPGGKTTHLAERSNVEITALDSDALRLQRLRDNFARLRLNLKRVRVVCGDATKPQAWWDSHTYDRILLDAPCSASGIVRRHPDVKWLRRASDIAAFAGRQREMLDALWPLLARGGKLVYATCSVFLEENDAVVAAFMRDRPDALRESITLPGEAAHEGGQLLPSGEAGGHNQDGFFYALLRKA